MSTRVHEIMNRPAFTCRLDENLDQAARLMWDHDVGIAPVVDAADRVVGVVTDRDVCMAAYTQGLPLSAIPIERAMAHRVYTCGPDDEVKQVEAMMSEMAVRRMPVVDGDDKPLGMVSLADIAQLSVTAQAPPSVEHEVARTFAAITRPVRRALAQA